MSWQAGILVLLVVTLATGTLWYERSRPRSQVVALVAALAALSVAGRIALSPVPNVVPSTDIILIAGYALGGAPGFAVGALTALISNFWLGQGPWTPWQMAGWGLVGVLGAALAMLTGGEIRRLPLALACGLAGFAYGALLDLSVMVTYGGEQSLDRYLALSARGLPFSAAHAAGNFVLALAVGPAMVRMLRRYRARFEFTWRARGARSAAAAGAGIALLATLVSSAGFDGAPAAAAAAGPDRATKWLRAAQNPDGGFGFASGAPSSPAMTGWAALGLEAAGLNPRDLEKNGKTPISYLRATARDISTTGDIERTILALEAAGLDSRRFAGRDLVSRLRARRSGSGSWGGQVNPTAFGVLALAAADSRAGNRGSAAWLVRSQNPDGGWGFARGAASDADTTGAVLQALAAAGVGPRPIRAGVRFLRANQQAGGGFALSSGSTPNAQSTAWAVQGLISAGAEPRSLRRGGRDPLDYIASVQARDGHYRYSRATDQTPVWVTSQALQAVSRKPFPLAVVPRARPPAGDAQGGSPAGSGNTGGSESPAATGAGPQPKPADKGGAPPSEPRAGASAPPPRFEDEPAEALEAAGVERSDDGEDPVLPELAAASFAGLVLLAGLWLLRRQPPAGSL